MSASAADNDLVEIDTARPIWDRFFTVSPLVLVGTTDTDGELDLAPKHMATPLGWQNYFGFVCSPRHSTCSNIERTGVFTICFPKPSQILYLSLAASPRLADGGKPILKSLETFPATKIDGRFMKEAYLFFECHHFKTIDGFGENCLITGKIVAAQADPAILRAHEMDDQELIHEAPLLAYLAPGRFSSIDRSTAFPFPRDMKK